MPTPTSKPKPKRARRPARSEPEEELVDFTPVDSEAVLEPVKTRPRRKSTARVGERSRAPRRASEDRPVRSRPRAGKARSGGPRRSPRRDRPASGEGFDFGAELKKAAANKVRGYLIAGGVVGLALLTLIGMVALSPDQPEKPGQAAFKAADDRIFAYGGDAAHGNTPQAEALAEEFSEYLADLDDLFFEGGGAGGVLTQGQFVTHCELREGGVAFLVHVPELKDYEPDAKDALLELSWSVASAVTEELRRDHPDLKLGVGLRGNLFYGGMAIGRASAETPGTRELSSLVVEDPLYAFFIGEELRWDGPSATTAAALSEDEEVWEEDAGVEDEDPQPEIKIEYMQETRTR
jgi:hypothetical protein